jgi:hypothetical protein
MECVKYISMSKKLELLMRFYVVKIFRTKKKTGHLVHLQNWFIIVLRIKVVASLKCSKLKIVSSHRFC